MSRETKFGLLLVCVLTSVFGVLVYKRMHKPADLVAGDHDPAAVAVSDKYPTGSSTEATPVVTEPPPGNDAAPANELLALAPNSPQPQAAPVTIPADDNDPFAPSAKVVPVTPAKPQTTRLPTDLDDDFFATPAKTPAATNLPVTTTAPRSTPLSVGALLDQSEPDPFATETPVADAPVQTEPVETFAAKSTPPAQEAEFDPFAAPPTTTSPPATNSVTAAPVETEPDPFGQEPPQAEPVTTSSRSAPVIAEPVTEARTFDREPEPVPVAKPMPTITAPATDSMADPFAAPEPQPTPVALPTPKPPTLPPAVVIDYPETKTAAKNDDPLLLDPLDVPAARTTASAAAPRQPQALPVDLEFAPAPARAVASPVLTPQLGDSGYVVEPGDNFWTISRKLYGTGKYFQALAMHNTPIVADPAKLKPGQRIAAPSVAELETRYAALLASNGSSSAAKPVQNVGFFISDAGQPMYRVGTDDTLSSIAYAHLGRASRWVQIYELNRHTLKDGNTLKVGAELRLPADASQVQMMGGANLRR